MVCAAALLWGASPGSGAPGDITYLGCITGESESGSPPPPTDSNACAEIAANSPNGANSGLDGISSVVVSPDGRSVYTAAPDDDAVARFDRDPATGALAYQGCITGEAASVPACTTNGTLQVNGSNSGMDGLRSLAVSPDGMSVYGAAQADDAIVRFNRDPGTGALAYGGCITGEEESGPNPPPPGSNACAETDVPRPSGINSGMDDLWSLAVSSDGTSVYAVSESDDAINRFDRAPDGSLDYQGCMTGEYPSGGSGACAGISSPSDTGESSGIDKLRSVVVSPDGNAVYVASPADDSVAHFSRAPGGAIAYQGCITGESQTGPPPPVTDSGACTETPTPRSFGVDSGMDNPQGMAISGDGLSVYLALGNDAGVARFDRDAGTSALTWGGCITGEADGAGPGGTGACAATPTAHPGVSNDSGLDNTRAVAVSADGGSLYAAGGSDSAINRFARDPANGALTWVSCFSGWVALGPSGNNACALIPSATANGDNSGLASPQSLAAIGPDSSLYAGAQNDDAVASFDIEPTPPAADTDPPETFITKAPKKKTKKRKAKFKFASDEPGSTFACKLDKKDFKPCDPSEKFKVKRKKHKLQVRATDQAGNTDPTPAKRKWKVKKAK